MVWRIVLGVLLGIVLAAVVTALFIRNVHRHRDMDYGAGPEVFGKGRRKKALVLHQPSMHGHSVQVAQALCRQLEALGWEATLDYPGHSAVYDPQKYDLLSFSSAVYLGHVGKPILEYLKTHTFFHKKVLVFTVGTVARDESDLQELLAAIPEENLVLSRKFSPRQQVEMMDFVKHALK